MHPISSAKLDQLQERAEAPLLRLGVLTKHGKETIVAEVFAGWNVQVERVDGFDTDLLGTFSREVPRAGSQIEAARRKAQLALQLSAADFGLGSEGAFCSDPFTGMVPWNIEVLCLLDRHGNEVIAHAEQASGELIQRSVHHLAELESLAAACHFPEQGLILTDKSPIDGVAEPAPSTRFAKELNDFPSLRKQAADWLAEQGELWVETDLRAHRNLARRLVIKLATQDLQRRLRARCKQCQTVNFVTQRWIPGLPCAACGCPTKRILCEVQSCAACAFEERVWSQQDADPQYCDFCNP